MLGAALSWLARADDVRRADVALQPLADAVSRGAVAPADAAALDALQPVLEALPPGSANAALLAVHRLLQRGGAAAVPSSQGGGTMHAAVAALAQLPEALRDSCLRLVCGAVPAMPPGALSQVDAHYLLQWLLVGRVVGRAVASMERGAGSRTAAGLQPWLVARCHRHCPSTALHPFARACRALKGGCLATSSTRPRRPTSRWRAWRWCAPWRRATCSSLRRRCSDAGTGLSLLCSNVQVYKLQCCVNAIVLSRGARGGKGRCTYTWRQRRCALGHDHQGPASRSACELALLSAAHLGAIRRVLGGGRPESLGARSTRWGFWVAHGAASSAQAV